MKTIIAGLLTEQSAASVVQLAADLAEQHQAHLTGLHVIPPLDIYVSAEMPLSHDLIRQRTEYELARAERLQAVFAEHVGRRGIVSEWQVLDDLTTSVVNAMLEIAGTADLLVLGSGAPEPAFYMLRDVPEHIVAAGCRPVLLVPDGYRVKTTGRNVFVAWDGGRASTRAVFDALPILERADNVRIHRINLSHDDRHRIVGITEALANTLARHGVNVDVSHADAGFGEVADDILQCAADMSADLLVMGAYSHGRLREFLLGSTTQSVLRDMRLPVLMSH